MAHVSHINTVEIVMILHILFVGKEDLIHKVREFRLIHQIYYFMRDKHVQGEQWQRFFSAHLFSKGEDVENPRVERRLSID